MSQLSYVSGTRANPLVYSDLPTLLDKAAEEHPEKAAHVFRFLQDSQDNQELTRTVITFRDLAERSLAVAAAFLDFGFKPGDTIAILSGNCPQYLYVDYACHRIKVLMIRVPINLCQESTILDLIARFGCKAMVVDGSVAHKLGSFIGEFVSGKLPIEKAEKVNSLMKIFTMDKGSSELLPAGVMDIEDLVSFTGDEAAVKNIQNQINPEDVSMTWPTSGSTGTPKLVAHTSFSYINSIGNTFRRLHLAEHDTVFFNDRPFSWQGSFLYCSVVCQITMLYVDNRMTLGGEALKLVYKTMGEEKVTGALLMPYILFDAMKAKEIGINKPSTLEYVITGGERIPMPLTNFGREEFTTMAVLYGNTECLVPGLAVISSGEQDSGSLSKLSIPPWYEIKITDDEGQVTTGGDPGQINVRSIFTLVEYLMDPEMTRKVKSPSGWFNTGDIGTITSDNLLEIVGRSKDIISRGTTKIYPKFIEDILLKCPGVDKVVVVGVPDPRLYQELCACIIPQPGHTPDENHLREFYTTHMLDGSCSPRYYLLVSDFPKGGTGKLDRKILASEAAEKLGLQQ